jgi:O-antigen ligase
MDKRGLASIGKILVLSLIFLLPTQLAYHFWPSWSFVFGIRVDLLTPAVYLTDILVGLLFLIEVITDRKTLFGFLDKYKIFGGFFLVFVILNCAFSISVVVSIYKWLKIIEFSFLIYYFSKQKIVELSNILKTLFYSLITFSLIGVAQFFKGGTVGGILYYLGERSFNIGTPGIALVSLGGIEHLRAYSTFSHPNSLAGFLGGAILLILLSGKLKRNFANFIGVVIILTAFALSFSVSAYLGIFLMFSFYLFSTNTKVFKNIIIAFLSLSIIGSLLLPIFSTSILKLFPAIGQNISQRLDLSYIAGQIISRRFFMGSGLGTFIVNIPLFKGIFSYSWLLQPVHNIFLLVFSELGILGLLSFCFLIYKTLTLLLKNGKLYLLLPIIFTLFTGLFDHYSLTLQQNLLLVSIFLGLSFNITS